MGLEIRDMKKRDNILIDIAILLITILLLTQRIEYYELKNRIKKLETKIEQIEIQK